MLEINHLHKSYGKTKVLTDVSLKLEENKIYGLLGRNGVGKTTLLNIMANQIKRDSGELKLFDQEIFESSKVVEDICIVRESGIGIEDIKVKKIFDKAKILYKDWDEEYKNYLVKEFKLNIRKYYSNLSRGNQTIVGLIIGLSSRAKLTIFDEPSLGLDAAFRYKFYNILLEDMEINPRTIIISTHLIDEVTNLFEEIIILKDEKIYIKDEVSNLLEKSYFLNGKAEYITPVIKDKKLIFKEEFGPSVIVGIFGDLKIEEKERLKDSNIDISPIPLQKLFIYLTENENQGGNINGKY